MIDLDALVRDPRWLPWSGWFDDGIKSIGEWLRKGRSGEWSGRKCADMNLCAIQQHRAEFHEFAAVLEHHNINGKCLQLGLGNPGASHLVWRSLFKKAITIDNNAYLGELGIPPIDVYLSRFPEHEYEFINMDSHLMQTVDMAAQLGLFDFLFIDTDHSYANVKDEYIKYSPLVRPGGIIAFHDTIYHDEYGPGFTVWQFMDELKSQGVDLHRIGSELGIDYMVKQ